MHEKSRQMALAGMLSGLCVVIMAMGSLIPVNTYVCPVICILLTQEIRQRCGSRMGWCGYMTVAILGMLLSPDREAAAVYVCMGYWPMLRRVFGKIAPRGLQIGIKLAFFTLTGGITLGLGMALTGTETMVAEGQGGVWLLAAVAVLWDVLFLLMDYLMELKFSFQRRKG